MREKNDTVLTPAQRRKEAKTQAREARRRKKEVARLRREHKKRLRVVPAEDRALLCTPDNAEMSNLTIGLGIALRGLVGAIAAFALTLFVCDALAFSGDGGIGISTSSLAFFILLICASLTAMFMGNLPIKLGAAAVFAATLVITFLVPSPKKVYHAIIAAFNAAIDRLVDATFLGMGEYRLPMPATDIANEELILTAALLFATVCSLVYVPSLIRRIRVLPPLILTAGTLIPTFIYNLSRGNWGISLVIASVAAMIVMLACDKLYLKPPKKDVYDETITLSAPQDEPPMPEALARKMLSAKERKEARRAEKERRRKEKQSATVSLDDELSDYFGSSPRRAKKKKTARPPISADEKKRQKDEINSYVGYKKRKRGSKSATGGFAGICALFICVVILLLPIASVSGRFVAIRSIDNTLQYYRDYVTALLVGNSPALDSLAYDSEYPMFEPQDTEAIPIQYARIPIMRLYTNLGYNTYLRSWIGVNYIDGKWHTVDSSAPLLVEYRNLFGTDYDPAETVKSNFYTFFYPDILDFDLNSSSINANLGVGITKIGIERYNLSTMNLFLPAYSLRRFNPTVQVNGKSHSSLMPLVGAQASTTTYANYFDGIYTSYAMRETNESFSTVAMLTNMRSPYYGETVSELIARMNAFRHVIQKGSVTVSNAKYPMLLKLADGTSIEYRTYTEDGIKYVEVKDTFEAHSYYRGEDGSIIASPSAPEIAPELAYLELMTYGERSRYDLMFAELDKYTKFVTSAYTTPAQSEIFAEILSKIAAKADIDLSLAAKANTYGGNSVSTVTDSSVYLERHKLTMAIVDYLSKNYTCTKTPTVTESKTHGIEKFLTETKEGYCIQFASALTLLLREAGIPARYTSGYVAAKFARTSSPDGAYYSDVLDENAHAWTEVWFDGIGWVQYEATPEYYDSAYKPGFDPSDKGSQGTENDAPKPIEPPKDSEDEPTPPPQITEDEENEQRKRFIAKIITVTVISLAVTAAFFLLIFIVIRKARHAEKERRRLLDKLANAASGNAQVPERTEVRAVIDMLFTLLEECALSPTAGQFGGDLALTLSENLDGILSKAVSDEGLSEFQAERAHLGERELKRVFSAIAAEEFGYGAPVEDMHLIVRLYRRLYTHLYRKKVPAFRRAWLYFIKRKI